MAVDLFRRVVITGTQQGQNLSAGAGLGATDDYLIHLLEQRITQDAREISQNEAGSVVTIDPSEDGAFWALNTNIDFPLMSELIADVTDESGVEDSQEFWVYSAYGGIKTFGA